MSQSPERDIQDKKQEEVFDLSNINVVTKYRTAADIANAALTHVIKLCVPSANISEICAAGDKFILAETAKIYKSAKIEKGIGFPTCVSVNNVIGHFAPAPGDAATIKENDLVKIDLGVNVDGFVAVVAHTLVVQGAEPKPVTGRTADVILAAHTAAEVALRSLKIGKKNNEVSELISKATAEFKCNPVVGVLSHQMTRFVIDGPKVILNKADVENKVDSVDFEVNEVYAIDIVVSTGEGKSREADERPTVFKRQAEESYQLKMKASRSTYAEIKKKFPVFPFNTRDVEEKTKHMGIIECVGHNLLHPYPVLKERDDELVAHFKFTALLMPTGTVKITGLPFDASKYSSEFKVTDETVKAVLNTSSGPKNKKKKKPAKKDKKDATTADDEDE